MNLFKTISLLSIILVTLILIFFIFTLQIKINQNERFYRLDLNGNGFPDVAELNYDDSENFRNWFTSIILNVVVNRSTVLPENYSDCAGLVRYAYKKKKKKHDPNLFAEKVLSKEKAFQRDWANKLASQIHDLPKYEDVFRVVKRHLKF